MNWEPLEITVVRTRIIEYEIKNLSDGNLYNQGGELLVKWYGVN